MSPLFARPGPEAEYFAATCEDVLGPWFEKRGFVQVEELCTKTLVVWRRGWSFVEINYWPQDAPNFYVMAGLGSIRDLPPSLFVLARKPDRHGIGLWEAVTDEKDRAVLAKTFSNRAELRGVLTGIRERAFGYAEPLLRDRDAMKLAIRTRKRAR